VSHEKDYFFCCIHFYLLRIRSSAKHYNKAGNNQTRKGNSSERLSSKEKYNSSKKSLKQESSSNAKSDSVRAKLPIPKLNDSLLKADTLLYPLNRHKRK